MSIYHVEEWPSRKKTGMQIGRPGPGVKVTDTETGRSHCCNIYHSHYANRDAAIYHLQSEDGNDAPTQD